MTVQIIGEGWGKKPGFDGVIQSPLSSPRSLDEFDVNIISLNDYVLWRNDKNSHEYINCSNDLKSVAGMVKNRTKSIVVYVMPQNFTFYYHKYIAGREEGYYRQFPIKDDLDKIWSKIINEVLYPPISTNALSFENTRSIIGNREYTADFYLNPLDCKKILTKSKASEKATTILLDKKTLITTLNITTNRESVVNFIQQLLSPKEKSPIPAWAHEIQFSDDAEQHTIISEREETISKAQADIEAAKQKLAENEKYKSILYTNGNELVQVVFSILEKLLDCDLSHFVDEKKEDFLIEKESCTFIGEIKGVTSNVRSEHVSQVDVHYQGYMDRLQEENRIEKVSQLLIINPFRTKALSEREPVHEQQIALAQRNGCLIIETSTLLRIYEQFLKGAISSAQCINIFSTHTGLLEECAFGQTATFLK